MSKPNTTLPQSFRDIARRTAFSFFLFSLVLTGLLLLSWFMLIPELTHVEIGGTVRGLNDLREYRDGIHQEIAALEKQRSSFLVPVQNDTYSNLKHIKDSRLKFQQVRADLRAIIREMLHERDDVILISKFSFDANRNIVELRGDVRNVGPQSMTVLAQFVERIHTLEQVTNVETSRYRREESPDIGFFSPFTIRLTIR